MVQVEDSLRYTAVMLIVLLGVLMVSCAREGPDRTNAVQVPLILLVLGAPALSYAFRQRDHRLQLLVFMAQFLAYIAYETGISTQTNIRIDLLLVYPALAYCAWMFARRHFDRT